MKTLKHKKIIDTILSKYEEAKKGFRRYEVRKFEDAIQAFGKGHTLMYISILNSDSEGFYALMPQSLEFDSSDFPPNSFIVRSTEGIVALSQAPMKIHYYKINSIDDIPQTKYYENLRLHYKLHPFLNDNYESAIKFTEFEQRVLDAAFYEGTLWKDKRLKENYQEKMDEKIEMLLRYNPDGLPL